MRAEPIVNGLKEEWADDVLVLQLNIHKKANEQLVRQLNAQFTPTFVLLDESGDEVWRQVGVIDATEARRQVELIN
jgi:protein-disulfide isomerase